MTRRVNLDKPMPSMIMAKPVKKKVVNKKKRPSVGVLGIIALGLCSFSLAILVVIMPVFDVMRLMLQATTKKLRTGDSILLKKQRGQVEAIQEKEHDIEH